MAGGCGNIRSTVVCKQKTVPEGRGACVLTLLREKSGFPGSGCRVWRSVDVRQLLVHRHKQVQSRTRVKNQLQAMALSQGVQKKRKLWTEVGGGVGEVGVAVPYAAQRRKQLLQALDGSGRGESSNRIRRVEAEVAQSYRRR